MFGPKRGLSNSFVSPPPHPVYLLRTAYLGCRSWCPPAPTLIPSVTRHGHLGVGIGAAQAVALGAFARAGRSSDSTSPLPPRARSPLPSLEVKETHPEGPSPFAWRVRSRDTFECAPFARRSPWGSWGHRRSPRRSRVRRRRAGKGYGDFRGAAAL